MESLYAEHVILSTFRELPAEGKEILFNNAKFLANKYGQGEHNLPQQADGKEEILFPGSSLEKVADEDQAEDQTEDPEDGKMPKLSRKDLDDFLYCISSCLLDNVWTVDEVLSNGEQVADRDVSARLTLVSHSLRFLAAEINTQVDGYNKLSESDLFTIAP